MADVNEGFPLVIEQGEITNVQRHREQNERCSQRMQRVTNALVLCLAFTCFGITASMLGPTFLDLLLLARVAIDKGSVILFTGSVGGLIGNIGAGLILETFRPRAVIAMSTVISAILVSVFPQCHDLALMSVVQLGVYVAYSVTDIALHALIVFQYGANSGPILQFVHFGFAFGGTLGPLIARPFVVADPKNNTIEDFFRRETVHQEELGEPSNPQDTHVQIAYLISGGLTMFSAVSSICWLYFGRPLPTSFPRDGTVVEQRQMKTGHTICLLASLAGFYVFYTCAEGTFSSFLATYVVKFLKWDKKDAALLTTVFWIAFAAARAAGTFTAKYFTPSQVLGVDLFLTNVSFVLFLICGQWSTTVAWVSCVLAGVGLASIYATVFVWVNESMMPMTTRLSTYLNTASSVGTCLTPLILGYLFDNDTPLWFLYFLIGNSILCTLIYLLLICVTRKLLENKSSALLFEK